MPQDPDDEPDERDDEPDSELSEAVREQLRAFLAPMASEINARLTESLASMLEPLNSQLSEAAAPLARMFKQQLADAMSGIDLRPLLPAFQLPPDLVERITRWRELAPPNWPSDVDLDRVTTVIQDEGLPLVWVPPAEIVIELLAAGSRAERITILLSHETELVADCRRVLQDLTAERVSAQLPLVPAALAAFEGGHHEAAQALAVVITDAVILGWITGKYEAVVEQVRFDPEEVSITETRLRAAVAPLAIFKSRFFNDVPPPEALNRQVVVHYAMADHFTRGNALVACLLMTSVLRALQEFEDRYGEDQ